MIQLIIDLVIHRWELIVALIYAGPNEVLVVLKINALDS